ncbi:MULTISPECIES: type IV secretion system protein TraC [Delftia]|uniref:Conjugal transfer ATP-binding protein TraC n=1 Tax=Delftia lacustris TaxID=558537 RepID=A0A1H3MQW3_9BURK|nr:MULTISPECIES: type IV secretion system protein TraC [Delftia]QPS78333.1 type IV secretion system protein TraC [Delftia acidovorans]QPS84894.1 type IV secretion system protein TraC [Delftia lacustris]SDY78900.1 conjugal transfer ATP-binding protein TraC [Delftia lacustris]
MSAVHQALSQASKRFTPDEYIPTLAYMEENGIFLCDDGHLGVCYWGSPIRGADDSTVDMLKGALSLSLPAGSFVQVSLLGMPDIDLPLALYRARRENGMGRIQSPLAREALTAYSERRADYLSASRMESNLPQIGVKLLDRLVVVSIKIPFKGDKPEEEDVDLIAESGAKLSESLQTVGLMTKRMTEDEYLRVAYRLTHPYDPPKTDSARSDEFLKSQVFDVGESFDVEKDALVLSDNTFAHMLGVSRWPERNPLSTMAFIIGDPLGANNQLKLPYHINLTLHYPDQYSKSTSLKQKAGWINYQAFGPLLRFVPKLAFKKKGMDVMINAIERGATTVEACLSVTVFSKKREEGSRQLAALRSYLQSFDFSTGEEKRVLSPSFWNAFPLFPTAETIKNTFRFKSLAVEQAVTFLPILGEWKGTSRPKPGEGYGFLLQSRRGQLMSFDLYDSPTNMNGVVFAESGAGKSFFTQMLVTEYLSMGAKVWVIDVGRSYLKLCKWLDGSFIEFGTDSDLCMNPFSKIQDLNDEVGLLQAMIEKMAAPIDGLDDLHRSRIEEAIKAVWGANGRASTITDVAMYMINQPDKYVQDIGHMLFSFTRNGSEGHWFDGTANLEMDKDLVVLELEELKSKKTLQQVVLMQIISAIQHEMYLSQDGRPKVLIIDEAWDLLDDPMIARFMEHAYRRFRKYKGSAVIVTQSIADLYGSPSGKAIAANSAFKFILRQNNETIDQSQKEGYLAIGEFGYSQLRTVHSLDGKYSEIMVYTNQGMDIARLVVDRFTQVLFSTSGNERTEVIKAIEAGTHPVQAIDDHIARYG